MKPVLGELELTMDNITVVDFLGIRDLVNGIFTQYRVAGATRRKG